MVLNYNNAVIYNIACLDKSLGDTYIGSTTNFKKMLSAIKTDCKKPNSKSKLHNFINSNGGVENFKITIIEELANCKSKKQMLNTQVEYMDFYFPNLNSRLPIIPDCEKYFNTKAKYDMKEYRSLSVYLAHMYRKNSQSTRVK